MIVTRNDGSTFTYEEGALWHGLPITPTDALEDTTPETTGRRIVHAKFTWQQLEKLAYHFGRLANGETLAVAGIKTDQGDPRLVWDEGTNLIFSSYEQQRPDWQTAEKAPKVIEQPSCANCRASFCSCKCERFGFEVKP